MLPLNRNTRKRNKPTAFTLIELLVVLSLAVLVAGMGFSYFPFLRASYLTRELETLRLTLHYLQRKACVTGEEQVLTIDREKASYFFKGLNAHLSFHHLAPSIGFGVLPEAAGPPSKPRHPLKHWSTFPQSSPEKSEIHFHPEGTIDCGTLYCVDRARSCMGALSSELGEIASVRIYSYHHKTWKML